MYVYSRIDAQHKNGSNLIWIRSCYSRNNTHFENMKLSKIFDEAQEIFDVFSPVCFFKSLSIFLYFANRIFMQLEWVYMKHYAPNLCLP